MLNLTNAARRLTSVIIILTSSAYSQNIANRQNTQIHNSAINIDKVNKRPLTSIEGSTKEYEKLVAASPSDAIALNNLGVMYFLGGRNYEAQSVLRRAVLLAPKTSQIRVNLAVALNKTYNPGLAIETLEAILKDDPTYHRARQVLCEYYAQQSRIKEAIPCYEFLKANGRLWAVSAANFGAILLESDQVDRALEVLRWADMQFPDDAGIKNGLGVALFRKNRFSLAEMSLQRAVELAPAAPQVRYNLAITQIAANKRGAVLEQYKYLKVSDPELAGKLYKLLYRDKIISIGPNQ
jgi:Flp pilus assembly protein TadD